MKRILTLLFLILSSWTIATAQAPASFNEPQLLGYMPFTNPIAPTPQAQTLIAKYLPKYASAPSCARTGQLYYDTTLNAPRFCSVVGAPGTWNTLGAGGSGDALTTDPLSQFAATTSAQLAGVITNETGSGLLVFGTSPNITTPTGIVKGDVGLGNVDNTSDAAKPVSTAQQTALDGKQATITFGTGVQTALGVNIGSAGAPVLFNGAGGTPTSLVGTNITGTAAGLTVGNVTTNANLTGPITSVGNATSVAAQTGTGSTFVMNTAPAIIGGTHTAITGLGIRSTGTGTFDLRIANTENLTVSDKTLTIALGDANRTLTLGASPSVSGSNTGDQTITLTGGVTGSGTGSFAATVVTNANLTGPITSTGNATAVAAQTGTGSTFVMQATPTLTTPTFTSYTVATLPAAGTAGRLAVVTDATTAGSCTVGGGTALAYCRDSGAAWVPLGDGGGGGLPSGLTFSSPDFTVATAAANQAVLSGSTTTNPILLSATGSDTNIDIKMVPKGSGGMRVGADTIFNNEVWSFGASGVLQEIKMRDRGIGTVATVFQNGFSEVVVGRTDAAVNIAGTSLQVAGVTVPTISSTSTLSNKRITARVTSITSNATWSPSADTDDMYIVTAQAVAVTTIANPSGTPVEGQKLMIRVKDDGTARALTWSGTQWRASSDLALPTTTTATKTMYLGFAWNSTDSKWDLLSKLDNF